MKVRGSSVDGETMEITVDKYFANHHNIELAWSAHVPCLNVGKPKRPNYLPIEVPKSHCFFPSVNTSDF